VRWWRFSLSKAPNCRDGFEPPPAHNMRHYERESFSLVRRVLDTSLGTRAPELAGCGGPRHALFYGFLDGRSAYIRWGKYSHAVILVLAPSRRRSFFLAVPEIRLGARRSGGIGFGLWYICTYPFSACGGPGCRRRSYPDVQKSRPLMDALRLHRCRVGIARESSLDSAVSRVSRFHRFGALT